jgi:hypothetical protein
MPFASKMPKGMSEELSMATAEADDIMGSELSMAMPKPDRPYSGKVVTNLAKAVAKLVGLMGVELVPEPYAGAVEALGEDEVRFLSMLEAAAAEYGQPFPMPLASVKGDAELTALTAYLTQLAADPEFEKFLNEDGEDEMEDDETDDAAMPRVDDAEGDDDFFASRV